VREGAGREPEAAPGTHDRLVGEVDDDVDVHLDQRLG